MNECNLPPTKNTLSMLKNELDLANLGYELLDQKRNIMILELIKITNKAVAFETQVDQILESAYEHLKKALIESGRSKLLQIAASVNTTTNITLSHRKIIGISLPVIETHNTGNSIHYSSLSSSESIDNTLKAFEHVLTVIDKLVEMKVCVLRLSSEIKKTIRRVNALEKITIPKTQEIMKSIENRLEETERNMMVLLKSVKKVLHNKREHS